MSDSDKLMAFIQCPSIFPQPFFFLAAYICRKCDCLELSVRITGSFQFQGFHTEYFAGRGTHVHEKF